jgi:LPXTG-motif cell wall-anchored protein
MKRLLIATVAAAATLSLSPMAVGAVPYGPEDPAITLDNPTPAPGSDVSASFFGYEGGEDIEIDVSPSGGGGAGESFRAPRAVVGTVTSDADGSATAVIVAPSAAGTYVVTGTGLSSGGVATATFVVTSSGGGGGGGGGGSGGGGGGSLPATGSDSNQLVQTGGVVLALGAGLVGVAALRRRRSATV